MVSYFIIIITNNVNLVPRACDPWEGNEGSGIIRCRKPGILAKIELRIHFNGQSDSSLKWIIPEPSFPSQGSQARGTRLEQCKLAIHFAEHNFGPFGHIFFVIVLFEPESETTLFRVLLSSLCLQIFIFYFGIYRIFIFLARPMKRTSKQRAV
jgi:hypothetical protein